VRKNSSHVGAQYLNYAATVCSGVTLAPGSVHKHLRFAAGAGWVRSILGCARNDFFFRKVMVLRAQMMPLGKKKIKKKYPSSIGLFLMKLIADKVLK